jgi:ribosomal protein L37AE/L43A
MAMNTIQFQPGMSLSELFEQYGTEAQCEQALEQMRWPGGFQCPHCGATEHSHFSVEATRYWQCRACRTQTSLRAGTIFHGSKLPLCTWFQAMFLISQSKNNIAALELKRQLGVGYPTAWRVKHKLMQVMAEREAGRALQGEVVLDDAYLGGERRGKAGRGSENKVPFVAAVQLSALGLPQVARFDPVTGFNQGGNRPVGWAVSAPLHPGAQRRVELFSGAQAGRRGSCAAGGWGGPAQYRHAVFHLDQHLAWQCKDRLGGNLSCLQFPKICPSLPGRIPIPVQPALRPEGHPATPAAGRRNNGSTHRGLASIG